MNSAASRTTPIRIAVTGDRNFLVQKRMSMLFDRFECEAQSLERVPVDNLFDAKWLKQTAKEICKRLPIPIQTTGRASGMRKNAASYVKQSRACERKIRALKQRPDFVFHLFGMYCPFWDGFDIPFSMYLDYTMALAHRTWEPWAPFAGQADLQAWLDCEAVAYANASRIFTFSSLVKRSLVEDYGVAPEKVFVTGAAGQFAQPYEGPKEIGGSRLLFNATNFERKGGDLVMEAFRKVRSVLPATELLVVGGEEDSEPYPGIQHLGFVSGPGAMERLFLSSDLLLAPARCEPYGQLLVEAANYGLPSIVSDRGGMKEIIEPDVNGVVLSELSSDCLAEAVISLLQDPVRLRRYSEAGRAKVRAQLNWLSIAEGMLKEMTRAVEDRRRLSYVAAA
ncbi:MAG: Glycosyltransferase involved in cell wall bisynthesis [Verrucomicrobia bacterium]|nr:MAG: Glycosyltransferase involved in cell wall bisynthesis [Verrucomicrobiota bacterium]